jgi:ribosomal protein S18 acetylase RimI-like enzyme
VSGLVVRELKEADLAVADRINREAFGTFFGLEKPMNFRGDGEVVRGRFHANPAGAFAADLNGELVACGFVMDWGSVGIFGPLTVSVERWGKGIARAMLDEMTAYMDRCGFALQGLFTHPQSTKHIRLYEEYGFRMQRITAVMAKEIAPEALSRDHLLFSAQDEAGQKEVLSVCANIAGSVFPGLDLGGEIRSIHDNGFGDTVLIVDGGEIVGFACCHQGAGSEAGSAQMLVKFAAVCRDDGAARRFVHLLEACEEFAASRGVRRLVAGTNTGRSAAYESMLNAGYKTWMNGIAMHKSGGTCYDHPGVFVVDDWR